MRFEAFTATILSNGVPLEEYKMEVTGREAKCYIVSDAGATFSVRWEEDLNNFLAPRSSCAYIYLDGMETGGRILDRGTCSATIHGKLDSLTTERPFSFAQIDEDHASNSSIRVGFGSIVLKVCRGSRGDAIIQPSFSYASLTNDSLHELAVKKLKVTQRATLGNPVAVSRQSFPQFPLIDPTSSPFITFTFIYRSKTMLQALGVIEYKPEPVVASPPPNTSAAAGPSSGARAKRPAQEIIDISSDDDEDSDVARAAKELAEAKKRAKARKGGVVDKKPKLEDGGIIDLN